MDKANRTEVTPLDAAAETNSNAGPRDGTLKEAAMDEATLRGFKPINAA